MRAGHMGGGRDCPVFTLTAYFFSPQSVNSYLKFNKRRRNNSENTKMEINIEI